MMVVMAIIALLMLLGAGALLSVRDQFIVDNAAEEIVSTVREAQNRSISFTQGIGGSTKVWGAEVSGNNLNLISVNPSTTNEDRNINLNPDVTLNGGGLAYVYFASPFGTPYTSTGPIVDWEESEKPSKEYVPTSSYTPTELTITIEYKGRTADVVINEQGDVHAQ